MEELQLNIGKDSYYARVMAIARRARQIIKEANDKGVAPWELALVKTGPHKPIKLAQEEFDQGLIGFTFRENLADRQASLAEEAEPSCVRQAETQQENDREKTEDVAG